jgi:hypothetical protein
LSPFGLTTVLVTVGVAAGVAGLADGSGEAGLPPAFLFPAF